MINREWEAEEAYRAEQDAPFRPERESADDDAVDMSVHVLDVTVEGDERAYASGTIEFKFGGDRWEAAWTITFGEFIDFDRDDMHDAGVPESVESMLQEAVEDAVEAYFDEEED